ncbi:hypothetical protein A0H81_11973 [Grifola frondosa]|uniref:Uncharacterized protein n=1 Tax=Grifola frondosa TaxID=5627 RepID=A0A1C7LUF3_GRIFR|nr:hypothetical protein A0H81_11973 [Grifola frondosa]
MRILAMVSYNNKLLAIFYSRVIIGKVRAIERAFEFAATLGSLTSSPHSPWLPSSDSRPRGLQHRLRRFILQLVFSRLPPTTSMGLPADLKESLDVDALGADLTNASISPFSSPAQKPYFGLQPATPIVVPPTPSPVTSPRSAGPSNSLASPILLI